ncbi:MAG: D-amino acid aminotransferase [Gemmatimonadaceae bacterium]|nr:D-amino acid aminotransferase [Gemmatimonadaceae bacterium]
MIMYLNGEYVPREQALIPVEDRGFLFGDGIYEGVRAVGDRMFEWAAHAERMENGLKGLRINFTRAQIDALEGVCEELVRRNGLTEGEAFLYLEVSRGAAPRTHHFPPATVAPTVFVSASKLVVPRKMRDEGCSAVTYPDMRWKRRDWKTVNLLGNVLARQAASEAGAYEAILHEDGVVTEGAATNVFVVLDGALRTHPLSQRILPGITRKVLMELMADLRIPVVEEPVPFAKLAAAEEVFVCGSTTDVTPVVRIDGVAVGTGKPGPLTVKIREAFEARLYQFAAR